MLDYESIVGMTEKEAEEAITAESLVFRVMKKDGQQMMGSMDYRDDRINLEIENDKVVRAYLG